MKKYEIIYADPPWAYRKQTLINRGSARAVEKEYPTMQLDDIADIPVGRLAADDSVLFLWATGPKLPEAIEVMRRWGFKYRTIAFVWVKLTKTQTKLFFGMGFYTRANAEIVLVGTRGRGLRRKDAAVPQINLDIYDGPESEQVGSPVGKHSSKPDEIRKRICRLYDGDKIELFAREAAPGWDRWGNEVESSLPSEASAWAKGKEG